MIKWILTCIAFLVLAAYTAQARIAVVQNRALIMALIEFQAKQAEAMNVTFAQYRKMVLRDARRKR